MILCLSACFYGLFVSLIVCFMLSHSALYIQSCFSLFLWCAVGRSSRSRNAHFAGAFMSDEVDDRAEKCEGERSRGKGRPRGIDERVRDAFVLLACLLVSSSEH
jgi:hypothetical protein